MNDIAVMDSTDGVINEYTKLHASNVIAAEVPRGGGDQVLIGTGTATIPNEIFNLVKNIIGAGVFSLPAGIAAFGNNPGALLPACLFVTLMGVISAYTFSLVAQVCQKTGASSYAEAWDLTCGRQSSWVIAASSAFSCMALNLAYSMILADTLRALLGTIGVTASRNMVMGVLTCTILFPLSLIKNLSSLAPFSIVGVIGSAYTGVAIAIRFFGGSYAKGGKFVNDLTVKPAFGAIGAKGALSAKALILISMLSTAYIAHFNAPKFFKELKNNTLERFNMVTSASFGISIAFYCIVSSLAFLTFGSNCASMVLDSYSSKDSLLLAGRFAVAVSLIFSYPLMFQGSRDGLLDLVRVPEEKRTNGLLNKLTLVLVAAITYVASQVTDLTFVLSMSGALLGTSLIFIFPTLMFRGAMRGDPTKKWENRLCSVIASLGGAIAMIGANMSLQAAL
ncbi:unnamed protein product [Cylindrotheca closterium]|uniref:Amino acid transporter transmembrane domain-containing protein n=1 Tax=Cylindrotheca closterium TaxID=2856 RepID=A0AAD2G6U8_9STRA|nr:unnamed protein product [Cylindrotheca closterium]